MPEKGSSRRNTKPTKPDIKQQHLSSRKDHKKSFYQKYEQQIIVLVAIAAVVFLYYILQIFEQKNQRYTDAFNNYAATQQSQSYNFTELNATLLSIRNALNVDNPILLFYAVRELISQEGNTSRCLYYQFRSLFDVNDVKRSIEYLTAMYKDYPDPDKLNELALQAQEDADNLDQAWNYLDIVSRNISSDKILRESTGIERLTLADFFLPPPRPRNLPETQNGSNATTTQQYSPKDIFWPMEMWLEEEEMLRKSLSRHFRYSTEDLDIMRREQRKKEEERIRKDAEESAKQDKENAQNGTDTNTTATPQEGKTDTPEEMRKAEMKTEETSERKPTPHVKLEGDDEHMSEAKKHQKNMRMQNWLAAHIAVSFAQSHNLIPELNGTAYAELTHRVSLMAGRQNRESITDAWHDVSNYLYQLLSDRRGLSEDERAAEDTKTSEELRSAAELLELTEEEMAQAATEAEDNSTAAVNATQTDTQTKGQPEGQQEGERVHAEEDGEKANSTSASAETPKSGAAGTPPFEEILFDMEQLTPMQLRAQRHMVAVTDPHNALRVIQAMLDVYVHIRSQVMMNPAAALSDMFTPNFTQMIHFALTRIDPLYYDFTPFLASPISCLHPGQFKTHRNDVIYSSKKRRMTASPDDVEAELEELYKQTLTYTNELDTFLYRTGARDDSVTSFPHLPRLPLSPLLSPTAITTWFIDRFMGISPFEAGNELVAQMLGSAILMHYGMLPISAFDPQDLEESSMSGTQFHIDLYDDHMHDDDDDDDTDADGSSSKHDPSSGSADVAADGTVQNTTFADPQRRLQPTRRQQMALSYIADRRSICTGLCGALRRIDESAPVAPNATTRSLFPLYHAILQGQQRLYTAMLSQPFAKERPLLQRDEGKTQSTEKTSEKRLQRAEEKAYEQSGLTAMVGVVDEMKEIAGKMMNIWADKREEEAVRRRWEEELADEEDEPDDVPANLRKAGINSTNFTVAELRERLRVPPPMPYAYMKDTFALPAHNLFFLRHVSRYSTRTNTSVMYSSSANCTSCASAAGSLTLQRVHPHPPYGLFLQYELVHPVWYTRAVVVHRFETDGLRGTTEAGEPFYLFMDEQTEPREEKGPQYHTQQAPAQPYANKEAKEDEKPIIILDRYNWRDRYRRWVAHAIEDCFL